jgi:hypothetical protein
MDHRLVFNFYEEDIDRDWKKLDRIFINKFRQICQKAVFKDRELNRLYQKKGKLNNFAYYKFGEKDQLEIEYQKDLLKLDRDLLKILEDKLKGNRITRGLVLRKLKKKLEDLSLSEANLVIFLSCIGLGVRFRLEENKGEVELWDKEKSSTF